MLSRVADSIYWLNRYIERAENIARFVEVNLNLLLDCNVVVDRQWEPLVATTGDIELFRSRYGEPSAQNVVKFLTNESWHFGQLGRSIERADKTARILDVKYFLLMPEGVGSALDELQWIALLKSASGYEMYRKTCHRITPKDIARFLIFDREFPRSIQSCLLRAERSLHQISGSGDAWSNSAERTLGKLRAQLDFMSIEEAIEGGLHEFLDETQSRLNSVSQGVIETFFTLEY